MSLPKNRSQMSFFNSQVLLTDIFFRKTSPTRSFEKRFFLRRNERTRPSIRCIVPIMGGWQSTR